MAVLSSTALLDIVKLDAKKMKNENEIPSLISSHIQAEPKILATVMKKLVELVFAKLNQLLFDLIII